MGKRLGILCALTLVAFSARAQDRPEALRLGHSIELSGGFAYTRFNLGASGTNTNGAIGALAINLNSWMQFSADATVDYGQIGVSHVRILGNHFGPRFFFRRPNQFHAVPYAEVLIGGSRLDSTVNGPGGFTFSDNGFSMKAGGGVDVDLSPRYAVRLINMDYYMTPFISEHQNNLWISVGFVIRFGVGPPTFRR
jgi:hypothetical protein